MEWILSSEQLPTDGENVEISEDGITPDGTADYKTDRRCMMAGIAGGNGYFSECGFATDGSGGCDRNLIMDAPKYWRRYADAQKLADNNGLHHSKFRVRAIEPITNNQNIK